MYNIYNQYYRIIFLGFRMIAVKSVLLLCENTTNIPPLRINN